MTNLDARLAGYHSPVLSAFRIIFGLLYTIHGSQKLFGWPVAAPGPIAVGDFPLWWGLSRRYDGALVMRGLALAIRRGLPIDRAMNLLAGSYPHP